MRRLRERFRRFMNHPAPANSRYKPTCYEHAANCYTHACLIVPAIVGSALLHRLSDDRWEKITAWMYGVGLCALFIVSTVFHIVSWKKSHLRTMEHCFHMCDRMMIYVFIAASYAPWLNLRELGPLASHMRWFIWLMAAGGTLYVFLYHEKLKQTQSLQSCFPATLSDRASRMFHAPALFPADVVLTQGHEKLVTVQKERETEAGAVIPCFGRGASSEKITPKPGDVEEEKLAVFGADPSAWSRSQLLCDLLCRLRGALSIPTTDLSHLPTHICI